MAIIRQVRGYNPVFGSDCWLAETAVLIGDIVTGEKCTFWYNAVVRGDVNSIRIGNNVNIQDNATIHGTFEKSSTTIGDNVSIGHNAIVHGCTLEENCLVGMGAIVMDQAVIGKGSIVAAGSVVLEGTKVEPGVIYAGAPAKFVKRIEAKNQEMLSRIAGNYFKYAGWFQEK